jgi:uncharacterized protein involved in exopolysaccharide biosynthesis
MLALLAALALSLWTPAHYRASTRIRAKWDERAGRPQGEAGPGSEQDRRLEYVRQRVLARAALQQVLVATHLSSPEEAEKQTPERIRQLLGEIIVRSSGPDWYVIECVHGDPVRATLVAGLSTSRLLDEAARERAMAEESDPERLRARATDARRALDQREAELARLTAASAGRESPGGAQIEEERRAVAAELERARARKDRIREEIAAAGAPATDTQELSAELARLRTERADLRQRYTDAHPDVQALDRRIQRLEIALSGRQPAGTSPSSALEAQLAEVEAEIVEIVGRSARLEKESRAASARRPRAQDTGEQLERLTQQLQREREAYRALLLQWQDSDMALRLGRTTRTARFEVLQSAVAERAGPRRGSLALGALLFGLALGVGAAVAAELRDPRIEGPEDLEELLPTPLLGTVPFVGGARFRRRRRQHLNHSSATHTRSSPAKSRSRRATARIR